MPEAPDRNRLRAIIDRLQHPKSFLGPVLVLAGGTAGAHAITAASLLLLPRLYSPAEFGVLGVFSSVFYTLAVVAGLRFEVAIALPKDDDVAFRLLCLAMLSALALGGVVGLVLLVTPQTWLAAAGLEAAMPYLWLLPPTIFATGLFGALQNWYARARRYALLARARVMQSLAGAAVQLGAGLAGAGPMGLVSGLMFSSVAAAAVFGARFRSKGEGRIAWPPCGQLRATAHEFRNYPLYSTWEALANSAAIQLPILLIAAQSGKAEVGYLMLAMSVVQAPMAVLGTATAQVFLSQAPERARSGGLGALTRSTILALLSTGGPLLLAIGVLAPVVFPIAFGADWQRAGVIAAWMAPWLLLQFVASPVTMVLYIVHRQRLALALQLGGLVFRLASVWIGAAMFVGHAVEAYAVSGAVFYAAMLGLVLAMVKK